MNDVLEHIPDARAALDACFARLNPGGVLCLNCPDQRGLYYRTADLLDRAGLSGPFDRLWQRGLPSPHVWYFTPRILRRAAAGSGFRHLGDLRLETIELAGLWDRIRYVREGSRLMNLASFGFALVTWPLARITPSDAVASFFRKG
jgi:hypothetical protein